jgi:hypothetical protein
MKISQVADKVSKAYIKYASKRGAGEDVSSEVTLDISVAIV